jgi:hypothetical protein
MAVKSDEGAIHRVHQYAAVELLKKFSNYEM